MPLAMGRPRRGMMDKENNDTSTRESLAAGSPPRVSRPWDNLKAPESMTPPRIPKNVVRCKTPPMLQCDKTLNSAHAKLPHERFTPLLRTTFSAENEPADSSPEVDDWESIRPATIIHVSSHLSAKEVVPLGNSTAQPCADTTAHQNQAQSRQCDGTVRLGNRDVKPLNLKMVASPMFTAALPIPNKPAPPQRTRYRYSIVHTPKEPSLKSNAVSPDMSNTHDGKCSYDDNESDLETFQPSQIVTSPLQKRNSMRIFRKSPKNDTSYKRHSIRTKPSSGMYSDDEDAINSISDDDFDEPVRRPNLPRDVSFVQEHDNDDYGHDDKNDNNCFPTVCDFLSFEDDERVRTDRSHGDTTLRQHAVGADNDNESHLSEPDTFDTFSSRASLELANHQISSHQGVLEENTDAIQSQERSNVVRVSEADQNDVALIKAPTNLNVPDTGGRLATSESEKPSYPDMSHHQTSPKNAGGSRHFIYLKGTGYEDDDDDDVFDGPKEMGKCPEIEPALKDLQRASIKAGNELAVAAFAVSTAHRYDQKADDRVSRAQGELFLRSRFLRRWHARYASIVDHAYFGAVLFLFCHDSDSSRAGAVALKNSKMIVLASSSVREIQAHRRKQDVSLFELCTSQRKYVFACEDDECREYWLSHMTMCDE